MDELVNRAEYFLHQPDVSGTVFDQKDLNCGTLSFGGFHNFLHNFLSLSVKANRNVDPRPGCDSTEILPPCRSTIFLQIAKPIPVPANSSRLCSRWNMPKIFLKYRGSIPRPLSCTANIHFFPLFLAAEICTLGTPALWYLMALPTRF